MSLLVIKCGTSDLFLERFFAFLQQKLSQMENKIVKMVNFTFFNRKTLCREIV